jgi:hypothetical protein
MAAPSDLVKRLRRIHRDVAFAKTITDVMQLGDQQVGDINDGADEIERLQAVVDSLECESDWCGKSPHGTPGKRGYDDGKCQICKAQRRASNE